MTQEDKQLLFKDLCARLPYGVKVQFYLPNYQTNSFDEKIGDVFEIGNVFTHVHCGGIDYLPNTSRVKPYLRPLSSMTEEEKNTLQNKFCFGWDYKEEDLWSFFNHHKIYGNDAADLVDWLNENHFDYRGLIPKGLALEAPEGMYKYE